MKICTKCKVEKDESEFYKDGKRLKSSCKLCDYYKKKEYLQRDYVKAKYRELHKERRKKNIEAVRAYHREYDKKYYSNPENIEKRKISAAKYRNNNREKYRESIKRSYWKHRDKRRQDWKEYREKNYEKLQNKWIEFRQNNKDKLCEAARKYRAQHLNEIRGRERKIYSEKKDEIRARKKLERAKKPEQYRITNREWYAKNAEERRKVANAYRKRSPEKWNEIKRKWYYADPQRAKEKNNKKIINITDGYIIGLISQHNKLPKEFRQFITKDLIETKRSAIKLKRELKTINNDKANTDLSN